MLDKIFGGGGGFLNAIMSLASMAMPQLALLNAGMNMLTSALGKGIGDAMSQLTSQMGMPKFIGDAVKGLFEQIFGGNKKETSAEATEQMNNKAGDSMKKFSENISKQIVEDTKQAREEMENAVGGSGGGKKGWLRALAQALGKVADKAAKELEEMGKNINKENPSEMLDYQAATQEFNLMMTTFTNAIKTIGESNSQATRKG